MTSVRTHTTIAPKHKILLFYESFDVCVRFGSMTIASILSIALLLVVLQLQLIAWSKFVNCCSRFCKVKTTIGWSRVLLLYWFSIKIKFIRFYLDKNLIEIDFKSTFFFKKRMNIFKRANEIQPRFFRQVLERMVSRIFSMDIIKNQK